MENEIKTIRTYLIAYFILFAIIIGSVTYLDMNHLLNTFQNIVLRFLVFSTFISIGFSTYFKLKNNVVKHHFLQNQIIEDSENLKSVNEALLKKNQEYETLNEEYLSINEEYKTQNDELLIAHQRLIVKDRLLEFAQKLAQIGHWELDIENNNLTWSDEIYRIFDLEPQEFDATYEAFLEHIHPEDRDLVNNAYAESIKTKTKYEIEHRLLLKNGVVKYVLEKCKTEYDEDGNPLRSVGTVQDITHRKQYERELIELNNRYNATFTSSLDAIIIMDSNRIFIDVNEAFTKIFGYKKDEVVGLKLKELKQFYDFETVLKIEQILKNDGKVENYKVNWINKLGEAKNAIVSVQIVKINNKVHFLSIIREIDNNTGAFL